MEIVVVSKIGIKSADAINRLTELSALTMAFFTLKVMAAVVDAEILSYVINSWFSSSGNFLSLK